MWCLRAALWAPAIGLLAGGCATNGPLVPVGTVVDDSGLYSAPATPLPAAVTAAGPGVPRGVGRPQALAAPGGETSVLVTADTLVGYDADTREQTWTSPFAVGMCDASVVDDGMIAVLTDPSGPLSACASVAAVDVSDGEVAWTRPLGDPGTIQPGVTLGGGSVYAGGSDGEVRRFDATTGAPRPPVAAGDPGCGRTTAFGDSLVAIADGSACAGSAGLRVIDTATGEQLWQRPVGGDVALSGVVTEDPLVLDVTEGSVRAMRRYDDQGSPQGVLGRATGRDVGFVGLARAGDVLIGGYGGAPDVHAYDVTTGAELWDSTSSRDPSRRFVGADSTGLIWVQGVEVLDDQGRPVTERQVVRTDARDPDGGDLLGSVLDIGSGLRVVGDDLIRQGSGGATVFPLPTEPVGPASTGRVSDTTRH